MIRFGLAAVNLRKFTIRQLAALRHEARIPHLNRARCRMRHVLHWLGRAGSKDCRSWREIEDISRVKRNVNMTHLALDAV
ncbi:hypothetical protein BDD21_4518 [Thiocapsa rosea]|uniref:Uncharacterized protein n=1 Tax=Thiocapsa rosea TaxID=69360 RepID=A0A495VCA4_9GAMM|nr:hypothetical protein BDD21_4518 [Thiocapsa rosea]